MSTYPFNRDFDIPVDGLPFNWNLEAIPRGCMFRLCLPIDGGKKRALLVEFSGARVRFRKREAIDATAGGRLYL